MENRFYVYIHRRLDTGDIFYVGKGSRRRAWSSDRRNTWWKNVANKSGFDVEIWAEGLEESCAFELEKKLIALFSKLGFPLTNLSEGGEGNSGYKYQGDQLVRLQKHIEEQRNNLTDPNIYTFYHLNGDTFVGTRVEFSGKTGIRSKEVAKLFQTKKKRNIVKNWALIPVEIKTTKKKSEPKRKPSNIDSNIYTFYHVLGDKFVGTRKEFSDYSQIELVKISGLFCKNPRRSVFGWALYQISPEEYTHLKI